MSCASCNEKEKLDRPWEKFLTQKNRNKKLEIQRKEKILKWQKLYKKEILSKAILDRIEMMGNEVATFYDERIRLARNLKNKEL